MLYDTIIVGGGPAGLGAALVLGRCCRRVLIVDAGRPRNARARHVHNFLSRDGIPPRALLRLGRAELARYGVVFRRGTVTSVRHARGLFSVSIDGRRRAASRTLLLATGVIDRLPDLESLRRFYGAGVFHCPYCDAWEFRGRHIAVLGLPSSALGLALNLLRWTGRVTLLTDGHRLSRAQRARAERLNIAVREQRIARAEPAASRGRARKTLGRIILHGGEAIEVDALFFNTDQQQRSPLPAALGCRLNDDGGVIRDRRQRTGVVGLYLAGDASVDVQFAIVAAAEGAKAGVAINADLHRADLARRLRRSPGRRA